MLAGKARVGQGVVFRLGPRVNANADLDSLTPRFAVEAREAIREHLATLFASEPVKSEGTQESRGEAPLPEQPPVATSDPGPALLPTGIPEAEFEALAAENATRHDWIAQEGRQQREVHGLYRRTADFRISTTDPDATPMHLKGGGVHLGYHTHYVVDGGKRRIILAVLVTPGEVMDNQAMLDLLWHVYFRWRVRPGQVTGDTKYGTIENIKGIEDAHIRAYVPLPDWEHMTPYYGSSQFTYDAEHDRYLCPQGQFLLPSRIEYQARDAWNTAPAQPSVMTVTASRSALQANVVDNFTVLFMPTTSNESRDTIRLLRTRKPSINARCGWNRSLQKPKSGMACDASVYDGSGA